MSDDDDRADQRPDDTALPEHLAERPGNRFHYDFPTAWLLGTQLVNSLRDMGMSAVSEYDPRDFMTAGAPIALDATADGASEAWIDFLADSGDSPRLVYQLAYLLQQESLTPYIPRATPTDEDRKLGDGEGGVRALPRGRLLVFGGDTAYPIATRRRLLERIRAPFVWAYNELYNGKPPPPLTDLLGVPGNHDYYNELNGYERVFHAGSLDPDAKPPDRVDMPRYRPRQQASYFAAKLPFGWQMWGLDIEREEIDDRQRDYFIGVGEANPPDKLIVVTSRPTFVYHAVSENEELIGNSLEKIHLTCPWRTDGVLGGDKMRLDLSGDTHLYERYWGTDRATVGAEPTADGAKTAATHDATPDNRSPRRGYRAPETWTDGTKKRGNETEEQTETTERGNYASVVSGLGGAFHHPSQVRFGSDAPRRAWPTSEESQKSIGERLLRPRKVFQAGSVGVIGLFVAMWVFCILWRAKDFRAVEAQPLDMMDVANLTTHPKLVGPVLNMPFEVALHGACPHEIFEGFGDLLRMFVFILAIAAIGGAIYGGVRFGIWLAKPIKKMETSRCFWARATHWLTHNRLAFYGLRWIGGNRRNAWGLFITIPAWVATISAGSLVVAGLWHWRRYLADAADGFGAIYVWMVLLGAGLFGLGAGVAGNRFSIRAHNLRVKGKKPGVGHAVKSVLGRIGFGLLGLLTAMLIVWTPYAWMRLIVSGRWIALVFFAYPFVRRFVFRGGFLTRRVSLRYAMTLLAYLGVIAIYCGIPVLWVTEDGLTHALSPWWGFPLSALLGAYLSCLWMGWYFFVCLQFDAHGNEAGGAARVVAYAQFMRLRLTRTGIEVFTIAAEDPPPEKPRPTSWAGRLIRYLWPETKEHAPRARVVDHFTIGTP